MVLISPLVLPMVCRDITDAPDASIVVFADGIEGEAPSHCEVDPAVAFVGAQCELAAMPPSSLPHSGRNSGSMPDFVSLHRKQAGFVHREIASASCLELVLEAVDDLCHPLWSLPCYNTN